MYVLCVVLVCAVAALAAAVYALHKRCHDLELSCTGFGVRIKALEENARKPAPEHEVSVDKMERAVAEGMSNIFSYTIETARQGVINDAEE